MTTSSASRALGATIAVGWICGMRALIVQEHRCEYRFRGKLTAHLGPSLEFPHIAAMPLLRNVDMKAVAGNHGTAKTRAVYRHEIDELPFRGRAQRVDHEHGRGLRHRLDNQHARHNRPRREMPLEVLLV